MAGKECRNELHSSLLLPLNARRMPGPDSSIRPAKILHRYGPVLMGAGAFACTDVLVRFALSAGAGVLTMTAARGVFAAMLLGVWLRVGVRPEPLSARARWFSVGLGILFAGNVFFLFKAIEAVEVSVAILTYFVYPLLTGLAAAAAGLEKLGLRGALAALAGFLGLALTIGAHPAGLAPLGIAVALAAACCRVAMLLLTRVALTGDDARVITWYTMAVSTAIFVLVSIATGTWQPPMTNLGWFTFVILGFTTAAGSLGIFMSTMRVGPFRTALFMNLEPLLATIGSALFLGEIITGLQAIGATIMIAALLAFQIRR